MNNDNTPVIRPVDEAKNPKSTTLKAWSTPKVIVSDLRRETMTHAHASTEGGTSTQS